MEHINSWKQLLINSFQVLATQMIQGLPTIIGALLLLLVGWGLAKIGQLVLTKIADKVGINQMAENVKFSLFLTNANIESSASKILGKVVFWLVFLVFLVAAMETLGWQEVSNEFTNLIGYLPKLFASVILFGFGLYIAQFLRDFLRGASKSLGISAGRFLSGFIYYVLLTIVTLTALKQAGIDTSIITSHLTLIIGAILLAASISYGFASRHILTNILSSFFSRRTFAKGQHIAFEDVKGTIVEIGAISVKLRTEDGEHIVIPSSDLISHRIKILSS